MHRGMKDEYGLPEVSTNFSTFQEDNIKQKKYTCCFMTCLLFSIMNGIYFSSGVYIYYKYIHNTSLNKPEDIDETYNKLKSLVDYACTTVPNIHCN